VRAGWRRPLREFRRAERRGGGITDTACGGHRLAWATPVRWWAHRLSRVSGGLPGCTRPAETRTRSRSTGWLTGTRPWAALGGRHPSPTDSSPGCLGEGLRSDPPWRSPAARGRRLRRGKPASGRKGQIPWGGRGRGARGRQGGAPRPSHPLDLEVQLGSDSQPPPRGRFPGRGSGARNTGRVERRRSCRARDSAGSTGGQVLGPSHPTPGGLPSDREHRSPLLHPTMRLPPRSQARTRAPAGRRSTGMAAPAAGGDVSADIGGVVREISLKNVSVLDIERASFGASSGGGSAHRPAL